MEKFCYDNVESNCFDYGGLYEWDELMNYTTSSNANPSGRQGICPYGWHVPSDAEWCEMETYLDPDVSCSGSGGVLSAIAGGKLKEIGLNHWTTPNTEATNSSGFTARPGGFTHDDMGGSITGNWPFWDLGLYARFYTSTESSDSALDAWLRTVSYDSSQEWRNTDKKDYACSVRCVKN